MPDFSGIGRGFDRLAPVYDRCVRLLLGSRIEAIQKEILKGLPRQNHCLIVGGGSGAILQAAMRQNLAEVYTYAELSNKMITLARKRLRAGEGQHVFFTQSWRRTLIGGDKVNYLVLPFVLDCYSESTISGWLEECRQHLPPGASIIVADFNLEREFGFTGAWWQALFIKLLYVFFRNAASIEAARLPRIAMLLQASGFHCQKVVYRSNGWIQASQWSMNAPVVTTA